MQDPAVAATLAAYTTWSDQARHWTDERPLTSEEWHVVDSDVGRQAVACQPSPFQTVVREFDEFPAFGFSGDDVVPGLIVNGTSVKTADLPVVPIERAPLTLRSSLASENPLVLIETPDSGTLAAAVADIKRDADNPPMVIDRVSYGRVLYFTMTSTEVRSAQELQVAIDAVNRQYSGEGTVDVSHLETISQSDISLIAYGGDQSLTLGAIRSGDINQFFGPANTATAAPLAFALRTLDGAPVTLSESADVNQLTCTRIPDPFDFKLNVSAVQGKLVVSVNSDPELTVKDENAFLRKTDGKGSLNLDLDPGINKIKLRYTNLGCDNQFKVTFNMIGTGVVHTESHPTPGCFQEGDVTINLEIDTNDGTVTKV
ncbi:MAG: hypothetical protein ACI8TP_000591 [Acidimicrobiales bacterium]